MSFWKSFLTDLSCEVCRGILNKRVHMKKRGRKPGPIINEGKVGYGEWPYYPYEGPIRKDGKPHEGVGPRRKK